MILYRSNQIGTCQRFLALHRASSRRIDHAAVQAGSTFACRQKNVVVIPILKKNFGRVPNGSIAICNACRLTRRANETRGARILAPLDGKEFIHLSVCALGTCCARQNINRLGRASLNGCTIGHTG